MRNNRLILKLSFIVILFLNSIQFAQNWRSLGPPGAPISICVSSKYILAGTGNFGILESTDNGNTWKYVQGIPYGITPNNNVMCIEHDPQNLQNVYAGEGPNETAAGNGFFKSTDGGETWEAKNSGLGLWPAIREISINPFHSNEIYAYYSAVGGPSIYKSIDYGESWNLFYHNQEEGDLNSTLIFNDKDSTVQYAFSVEGKIRQWKNGDYSEILSSKNFYSSGYPCRFLNSKTGSFFYANLSNLYKRTSDSDWVSILNNAQTDSLEFNRIIDADVDQQSGTIYVCTDIGVLISSNDGDNWLVNKDLNDMKVTIDSSRTILIGLKGLYSSVDSGKQWSKLSSGLNISSVNKSSIVSKAGKLTIYLLGSDNTYSLGSLFKTTDEGASWTTSDLADKVPNVIKANPLNPDIVYIGCMSAPNLGLYKSFDGGVSWKQIKSNIPVNYIEILPNDTSHLLIGSKGGILESFDSGNSWDSLLTDMKDSYYKINVIKVSNKNSGIICAGLWSNYVNNSGFYISTTNGSFWERKMNGITDNLDNVDISAIAIDPKNDNNIFIGNRTGIYRTTDMGSHWLLCNSIGYISDIEIAPDNPNMILATSGALGYDESGTGLYLSQDGGNSWERITFTRLLDETRNSVDILPEGNNYRVFVGTKSNGYFEGEYPREIILPAQPIIISPNGIINVSRKTTLLWHPSDLAMKYNLQIAEDSSFSSIAFDTTLKDTTLQLSDALAANASYFWHVNAVNIYGDTSYSLTANFSTGTAVGVIDEMNGIPKVFALSQNYPNPFNPSTIINYEIPKSGLVVMKIYDVLGKEVETLVNEEKNPGRYKVEFKGSNLSSGLYFYRIISNNFSETKKMLLLK